MAVTQLKQAHSPAIDAALARARDAEAAHYEARLRFTDAKLLRLAQLRDDLAPVFAAAPGIATPDLAAPPDDEPRLWIDLVTAVIMAPDPQTYRLQRDTDAGREILCETAEASAAVEAVRTYLLHRRVNVARQSPPESAPAVMSSPARPWGYLVAISAGFALGAMAATILAMSLK